MITILVEAVLGVMLAIMVMQFFKHHSQLRTFRARGRSVPI